MYSLQIFAHGFGVIQNNIALKLGRWIALQHLGFGVIQNNIALKRLTHASFVTTGFGVIQNNIALKLRLQTALKNVKFWSHTKQHSSKTVA